MKRLTHFPVLLSSAWTEFCSWVCHCLLLTNCHSGTTALKSTQDFFSFTQHWIMLVTFRHLTPKELHNLKKETKLCSHRGNWRHGMWMLRGYKPPFMLPSCPDTYRECNMLKCFSAPCYHTLLYHYHVRVISYVFLTSGIIPFASFITFPVGKQSLPEDSEPLVRTWAWPAGSGPSPCNTITSSGSGRRSKHFGSTSL